MLRKRKRSTKGDRGPSVSECEGATQKNNTLRQTFQPQALLHVADRMTVNWVAHLKLLIRFSPDDHRIFFFERGRVSTIVLECSTKENSNFFFTLLA